MTEILLLKLKQGIGDRFANLYVNEALPLLHKWKFEVLAHGPSLHDATTYYVIRHFKSLEHRQQMEDAYYSSDDWQHGPRAAVFEMLEGYHDIVLTDDTFKNIASMI